MNFETEQQTYTLNDDDKKFFSNLDTVQKLLSENYYYTEETKTKFKLFLQENNIPENTYQVWRQMAKLRETSITQTK